MEQASADMARLLPISIRSFPAPDGFSPAIFEKANISPNLRPLKQDVVGDMGNVLWVLMGSIAMVLLVACANVANLLLVRVEGRRQELAIRSALGAGWKRITAELLFESAVLGILGSLIGLALAYGALRLLVAMAPTGLPRIHEIGIDIPVLLFTLGLALLTSVLIGLIPVMKYAGGNRQRSARRRPRAEPEPRTPSRAQDLVVVQVALALVLLICSGLMIRTFRALMQVSPGFASPNALADLPLLHSRKPRYPMRSATASSAWSRRFWTSLRPSPASPRSASPVRCPWMETRTTTYCLPRTTSTARAKFRPSAASNASRPESSPRWALR